MTARTSVAGAWHRAAKVRPRAEAAHSRVVRRGPGVPDHVRAFVSVPLYVVIVTSFKTMDQIALGEIFLAADHLDLRAVARRPGPRSAPA